MTTNANDTTTVTRLARGAAIGAAGGLAEVLVVATYTGVVGSSASDVARAVATAVGINGGSAATGVAVHMGLSVLLGILLLMVARRSGLLSRRSALFTYAAGLGALGMTWVVNFNVVLPVLCPGFVHLLPYEVTLASKLMFGVAAAAALRLLPGAAAARSLSSVRAAPAPV